MIASFGVREVHACLSSSIRITDRRRENAPDITRACGLVRAVHTERAHATRPALLRPRQKLASHATATWYRPISSSVSRVSRVSFGRWL